MNEKKDLDSGTLPATDLRQAAEQRLRNREAATAAGMAEVDLRAVLHELQVHQIELEMQNEELLWARTTLQELSDKYHDLFDFAPVGYFRLDGQGGILEVNLAGAAILGIDRSTALGLRVGQFVAMEHRTAFAEFCKRALAAGEKQTCEIELHRNAQAVYVAMEGVLVRDGSAAPSLYVTAIDTTEQKLAESEREVTVELLQLINQRYNRHELLQAVTTVLHRWSGCEAVGIRLREGDDFPYFVTHGFPPEFVLAENRLCAVDARGEMQRDSQGNPVLECMCGNVICGQFDPAKPFFTTRGSFWSNCTSELLASTTEADRQARTRNRCNGEGYESVALLPLRAANQTFGLLQVNDRRKDRFTPRMISLLERLADSIAIGLAHRKAQELQLENASRLERAVHAGKIGLWECDLRTNRLFYSSEWKRLIGYEEHQIGNDFPEWQDRIHPDDLDRCLRMGRAFIEKPWPDFHVEFRLRHRDGSYRWFLTQASLEFDDQGKAVRIRGSNVDVTERKVAEERLREAERLRAESEKLAATGRMAAEVAHEINNPLAGIKNSFRLIKNAVPKDHPDFDMVERIEREIDRIARIVRQMYQIYTPRVEKLIDIPVGEIVRNVLELLAPLLRRYGVTVEVGAVPPEVTVRAYEGSLQQILFNLLANAIEVSSPAAVVHVTACPADQDCVRISVRDHGPGIPAEVRARMFEPFVTAATRDTGCPGGTPRHGLGIGLAIVKNIVESLKGKIAVESAPGEGTSFHVDLPAG